MKAISVFNNKGGVGKTTLTYHLANALSEMGYKVLMFDADPQCNLTIYSLNQEAIHNIWAEEDPFIYEGFKDTRAKKTQEEFKIFNSKPRSLHYHLKPTEDGAGELDFLPPPVKLTPNLGLVPGRLSLHLFEEKLSSRWTDIYRGDSLAIETVTRIRSLAESLSDIHGYDFVIVDTSPSLGTLNKAIISTVDGFFVPAFPDHFSLYGIRNIGNALSQWQREFDTIYQLISEEKRKKFPRRFVSFLGYCIYNAKKRNDAANRWKIAKAHFNYAEQIPSTITTFIKPELRNHLTEGLLKEPVGGLSILHTHNTFPAMAQYYHKPMWEVPGLGEKLEPEHRGTLAGARADYEATKISYVSFATALLERIKLLDQPPV
jgi:cellulose biosynthesis protein BcsQ